MLMTNREKVVI